MARNPALEFLAHFEGWAGIELRQLIEAYAQYMLVRTDTYNVPVNLQKIFHHYELDVYKVESLGRRGAVTDDLHILINASDPRQVQNYSLAHELIEIFIAAVRDYDPNWLSEQQITELLDKKEYWCELAAADIVMPMELFRPLVIHKDFSLNLAKMIAQNCDVSLIATLRRMLEISSEQIAIVVWYFGHKPNDYLPSSTGQMTLGGDFTPMDPPKKLRVEYFYKSPKLNIHIREHKSVEMDTAIGRAFGAINGSVTSGYDYLEITSKAGAYWTEAMPINYGAQPRVMSLIFFDRQSDMTTNGA